MKSIELKTALIQLRDDHILHLHLKSRSHIDMQVARDILEAMRMLGHGKKYPVLIDAGELVNIDPRVRVFSAGEEGNLYTLADAIAYHSLAQKLVASFYVTHDKPVVPTKTFSEKKDAIEWLKSFAQPARKNV